METWGRPPADTDDKAYDGNLVQKPMPLADTDKLVCGNFVQKTTAPMVHERQALGGRLRWEEILA